MQLEFLADRDLGKRVVEALRSMGLTIHTLPEVFGGEDGAMGAEDVEWIKVAGDKGWAALTKNKKIRYDTQERDAVARHNVPLFALVNGNLTFPEMAGAFLNAVPRILDICDTKPGGSIWVIHRDGRVEAHWP